MNTSQVCEHHIQPAHDVVFAGTNPENVGEPMVYDTKSAAMGNHGNHNPCCGPRPAPTQPDWKTAKRVPSRQLTIQGGELTIRGSEVVIRAGELTFPGSEVVIRAGQLTFPDKDVTIHGGELFARGGELTLLNSDVTVRVGELTEGKVGTILCNATLVVRPSAPRVQIENGEFVVTGAATGSGVTLPREVFAS